MPPYLAMSYLYKRSNRLWHLLIRHNLVRAVWWPLVEATRRRHLAFRRRHLATTPPRAAARATPAGAVIAAGV